MLIQLILFIFLLIILFFLSQKIQNHIYSNVFIVTQNRKFSIGVLIALLLPGTFIHEISHFLVATILRVPTGELTILPTIGKNPARNAQLREAGGEVKAGKLFLGQTDPFRLTLIGLAPMIIGLVLIYLTGKMLSPVGALQIFVICYLLFVVSITMFSSKKDLQAVVITGPIVFLIISALYLAGIRIFVENNVLQKLELFLTQLNYFLAITALLNGIVFILLSLNLSLWQKLLKRKVVN